MEVQLQIKMNAKLYLRDPETSELGKGIIRHGIEMIYELGFEDFTFKKPLSEKSQTLMNEIKSCESLCINVRRADFVDSSHHGTMGNEYYDEALLVILKSQKIDKIFVFYIPSCY